MNTQHKDILTNDDDPGYVDLLTNCDDAQVTPLYFHPPHQPVRLSDDKVFEVAKHYTAPELHESMFYQYTGNLHAVPTGETMTMTYWNFCTEELLAFARELMEKNQ